MGKYDTKTHPALSADSARPQIGGGDHDPSMIDDSNSGTLDQVDDSDEPTT